MLGEVAGAFAAIPGVIGYDPLNEPWGDERREIAPLYRDAAQARPCGPRLPTAILFLECARADQAAGHPRPGCRTRASTTSHSPRIITSRWPSPLEDWGGQTAAIDRAFRWMEAKAAEWGVPLLLGEIGIQGCAGRAGDYVDYLYDRLDTTARLGHAVGTSARPTGRPSSAMGGTARTSACSTPWAGPGPITGRAPIPGAWPACP